VLNDNDVMIVDDGDTVPVVADIRAGSRCACVELQRMVRQSLLLPPVLNDDAAAPVASGTAVLLALRIDARGRTATYFFLHEHGGRAVAYFFWRFYSMRDNGSRV